MKYQFSGQSIPQESRQELNNKILYLIDNDLVESSGITTEDVYNAYTGDGGLHGLKFQDYDSYAEFSSAKKEIENGQFFTPDSVCQFIMECLAVSDQDVVADLTCGMGGFFNHCPVEANVYGCELDVKAYKVAHYLFPKANLVCGDIRTYNPGIKMDYIVGNPPFNLRWWVDGAQILSQLYYCQKAAELLKPMGIMALVVPRSFLADDFSDGGLIKEMEKHFSFLGQFSIADDTFKHLGVSSFSTKIQFWQKNSEMDGWKANPYSTDLSVEVSPSDQADVKYIQTAVLADAQEMLRKNKSHILLELARDNHSSHEFLYQVKKYLFHIKSNPAIREKYVKCCEYLSKYYTQKQPEGMSYEEWSKRRITEAKVLAYLRNTVRKQHPKPLRDEVRLVKQDYSLVYKAYSPKAARRLTETAKMPIPIYQIVSDMDDPNRYGPYARMIRRRQREYQIEQQVFAEMKEDKQISTWLNNFVLFDSENEEDILLNDKQKRDINVTLQKRYSLLQWEQGSGKTLAGIATGLYRMQNGNADCTWVISPAISIKNNWDLVLPNYTQHDRKEDWDTALEDYGLSYVMVNSLSDLERIKPGDFVLTTMNKLGKYQRQIKQWIRQHNQKVALVFDESDEMTNPYSIRSKATLNCFRRCKYKLLMTGTSTRNNISEFAPQLELAYNNSVNMISWCREIYRYEEVNKKKNILEAGLHSYDNPYYGQPIPAYQRGYKLFAESHLPEKITVFGVGQKTQDIYNAEELSDILKRLVITRTFKEIVGKEIRRIHQVPIQFSPQERAVYTMAIEKFHEMRDNYFASTGNSRKDAMMRLIQQITLLLRISAAPNTVREYTGKLPTKIATVINMTQGWADEVVAIGVRHKVVVDAFATAIREAMPDRKLFVVTGATMSLAKRRALRKTLRESKNGILLCTQQSLPSSVNFEYVNKVIIPELHYNNSRMSQFYMRFVRFNSEHWKDIYFVTHAGSIESNLMQMVLAKERLNLFMRGQDASMDEIYEKFGVNYDLLSLLMSREEDDKGHFQIRWGQQFIDNDG